MIFRECALFHKVYPQLTAYFYSNLSFNSIFEMEFSVFQQDYKLLAIDLYAILRVKHTEVSFIPTTSDLTYRYLYGNSSFIRGSTSHISHSLFPLNSIVLHKIIINCLRPKGSSKTDVSQYETKLIWAIQNTFPIYLSHLIILQIHRIVKKSKG